jgi:hypothetical protein
MLPYNTAVQTSLKSDSQDKIFINKDKFRENRA